MFTFLRNKQPIATVKTTTDDASNDKIWEIIDKEDDGNNMLCFKNCRQIFNTIL